MDCLAFQPELMNSRDKFKGGGREAFVNMYGIPLELIPFRTAVPFWGHTTPFSSSLSPKRYCGSKGVIGSTANTGIANTFLYNGTS